jgi:probable phosphomutase (TIGR03848 family)
MSVPRSPAARQARHGITLLLVRHAQTDWVGAKLAGWTPGIPLNAEGRRQAWALSGRLSALPLEAVYSSPIDRSKETAQIIAAPHRLPVRTRERLGETHYGDWTGRSLKALSRTNLWKQIQTAPSGARFPNGETLDECQERFLAEIAALRAVHASGIVAVVSHADPIRLAVAGLLGMPLNEFQKLVISPASVTVFYFAPDGIARLVRYNDTGTTPTRI